MAKVCQTCHTVCEETTKVCPNCGTKLILGGAEKRKSIWEEHGHPHSTVQTEIPMNYRTTVDSEGHPISAASPKEASTYGTWSSTDHPHTAAPQQTPKADVWVRTSYSGSNPQLRVSQVGMGMVWYYILIWVCLFLTAAADLLCGFMLLTDTSATVTLAYDVFPGLETLNMIHGGACIALGAFCIFTRMRLARFCKNGPVCLTLYFLADFIVYIAYAVGLAVVVQDPMLLELDEYSIYLGMPVIAAILLVVNAIYFHKRKHLFINL